MAFGVVNQIRRALLLLSPQNRGGHEAGRLLAPESAHVLEHVAACQVRPILPVGEKSNPRAIEVPTAMPMSPSGCVCALGFLDFRLPLHDELRSRLRASLGLANARGGALPWPAVKSIDGAERWRGIDQKGERGLAAACRIVTESEHVRNVLAQCLCHAAAGHLFRAGDPARAPPPCGCALLAEIQIRRRERDPLWAYLSSSHMSRPRTRRRTNGPNSGACS